MFKIANLTDANKRIRLTALDSAMSNIDDSVGAIAKDGKDVLICLSPFIPTDSALAYYWEGAALGGGYYVGGEDNFIWTVNGKVVAAEDLNSHGIYFEEKSTQADPYDPYSSKTLQRIVSINPTPVVVTMAPLETEFYQTPTEAPNSGSNYSADTDAGVTTFTFGVYEPELAAVVYLNETMRTVGDYKVYAGANDPEFGLKLRLVDYWTKEVLPAGSQTVNYGGTSYSYVPDVVFYTLPVLRTYAIENVVLEEGQLGPAATYYFPTEVYVDGKAVPLTVYRRIDTSSEDYNPTLTSINISHWLPLADEFEVTVSGKTGIATRNGESEVPYSVTIDGAVGVNYGNGSNYELKLTLPEEFKTNGVRNGLHAMSQYMGPDYTLTTNGNTELVVAIMVPGTAYNSLEPVLLKINLTNITYA